MFARCFLLLLAFAGLAPSLPAQQGRTQLIGTEQGLSQGMVFDILQSRDGFLWIATKDGLNRYDGSRFEVPDLFNAFSISGSEHRTAPFG
jgi:ligand-binding sensor domain-containing protein